MIILKEFDLIVVLYTTIILCCIWS